jgi:hypothetical protein
MQIFDDPNELPTPPLLSQIIWLHYKAGDDDGRIACVRCAIRYMNGTAMRMATPEPFLDAWGARAPGGRGGTPADETIVATLVPCKYVTYLGLGPEFTTKKGGVTENRLIILPTCPTAPNAMTIEKIKAALAEFCAGKE